MGTGIKVNGQQNLSERSHGDHVTGTPLAQGKVALDVRNREVFAVGTDAVDSYDSDTRTITAAGHAALAGDILRMTSGSADTLEFSVYSVGTNTIVLHEDPAIDPAVTDNFTILRPITLTLSETGYMPAVNTFMLDGSEQAVTEDTVTPANNKPLPVKLTGVTGDLTITAQNLDVQSTHTGANPDSMQIGDGTETVAVNASNEMQVADDTARTSLATIAGDTTSLDGKVTACDTGSVTISAALPTGSNVIGKTYLTDGTEDAAVNASNELQVSDDTARTSLSSIDGKIPAVGQAAMAASLPVAIASDQSAVPVSGTFTLDHATSSVKIGDGTETANVNASNELQVRDDDANTALTTIAGDTTSIDGKITACDTGAVTISAALPAGTNNIGDFDLASAIPAGSNIIGKTYLTDGTEDAAVNASNELQVRDDDANTALSTIAGDTTSLDGKVTACNTGDVTVGSALPSGTNTIGKAYITDGTEDAAVNASNELQVRDDDANTSLTSLAGTVSGSELQVDLVGSVPAGTNEIGYVKIRNLKTLENSYTDASSTNIPGSGSSPLELIASTSSNYINAFHVFDTTGGFLEIMTGAAASETRLFLVGPGNDSIIYAEVGIGTRISVRRVDSATALSSGSLAVNYMGYA